MNSILIGPLAFHGSSNSSDRLRRNRRISHSLTRDPSTGAETLFIRFVVEGRDPNREALESDESWLDWAKKWIGPLVWQDSHHPDNYHPTLSIDERERERALALERERAEEAKKSSWSGFLANAFGGLTRGIMGSSSSSNGSTEGGGGLFKRLSKPKLGEYSTGEVVAELQKVHTLSLCFSGFAEPSN